MPCMGPSQEFAFARGEEVYEEVIKLLKTKYDAERPHIIGNAPGFEKRMQKDWDKQAEELKTILKELVWTSDAASW